jgi:NitT/TauT family transport system substrate-binding protein
MAKAVGLGAPVKMVMGIIQRSPMAIVVAANSPIRSAQDLKGKSVASCPGSLPGVFLPAYLGAVGIPVSDVKVVSTQCGPAMYQTIPMKQADAMAGYAPISRGILKSLDVPEVRSLAYSDAGILIPAFGILASTETIKSKPDVVRRFLAATVKGWEEAKRDPDAAVAATVAANPLLKGREGSYKEEFLETLEYVETPNTKGKPFGWQSVDDWKAAQEILVKHMDVKPQSNVDVYFTNEFLPK